MSFAVKHQLDLHGDTLRPGDVVMSNHPSAGGSHLPDITLITPVFDVDGKTIIFFVASRGHHVRLSLGARAQTRPLHLGALTVVLHLRVRLRRPTSEASSRAPCRRPCVLPLRNAFANCRS